MPPLLDDALILFLCYALALLAGTVPGCGAAPPTPAQQSELVFWHNRARSDLAQAGLCSNMLAVEWSAAVGTAANSNACPTTHNGLASAAFQAANPGQGGLGENLAWASNSCSNGGMCAAAGICGSGVGQTPCESNCDSICTIKYLVYTAWYQSESLNPATTTDTCKAFNNGGGHCSQVRSAFKTA